MNNRRLLLTVISLVLLFMQANRLFAQGVLFSEYRVILKNQLITSLQVCNPTEEVLSFSLSFINKTMDENGTMHEVADTVALPTSLKNYLRIYPRSIRLDPGQCQEVQIQLKAPPTIADGEYRSYLHFLPMHVDNAADSAAASGGVQLAIVFRVGAAIPIIYRKNTGVTEALIDSVGLTPRAGGGAMLNFIVRRFGTQSTYGRFIVEGVEAGLPVTLMDAPGNAVFTEIDFKRIKLPISTEKLDRDAAGRVKLKISYIDAENRSAPKQTVWATTEVDVGLPQ